MEYHRSHEAWLAEQASIKRLRTEQPDQYERIGAFQHQDILRHIGITTIPDQLPTGYIRFRPEDFIVEEIDQAGTVATIEPASVPLIDHTDHRTLYCQLIKIGIATPEALERLALALKIDRKQIGYAGLKDGGAVTSQNISLRGVPADQALALHVDNVILKNLRYGSGAVSTGELRGNRFTLTIRTPEPVVQSELDGHVRQISAGVLNYFGPQRFGSRWLSHFFGRTILQGQYNQTIKSFLTDTNASERKYVAAIREAVGQQYGDWAFATELYGQYPYTFQHELTVVRHLQQHPDDWVGALTAIQEQTRLWVYAYTSWLVNQTISDLVTNQQPLPNALPIPLSSQPADLAPYRGLLEQDQIPEHFITYLRPLPFIRPQTRYVQTRIQPVMHGALSIPAGVILSFDLPAGAYATTVLMNLFTIESGQPAPAWIKADDIDAKQLLGTGTVAELKRGWAQYFTTKEVAVEE
ncbi:MAG: tRNA pseudouridine(13) synthase TruD [Candidatus Kerfeldbacteria bacterium]|nr:tRNA pseudouridine(13) synthase TruD [Candidatus Kerfeldbacteria bacterium]